MADIWFKAFRSTRLSISFYRNSTLISTNPPFYIKDIRYLIQHYVVCNWERHTADFGQVYMDIIAQYVRIIETTLERAEFTRELLMFLTTEKERLFFFFSIFGQLLSPQCQAWIS